ncbi:MAG: hypothetical protein ACR5LD_09535 [Symbiopectobacterium sp.]
MIQINRMDDVSHQRRSAAFNINTVMRTLKTLSAECNNVATG